MSAIVDSVPTPRSIHSESVSQSQLSETIELTTINPVTDQPAFEDESHYPSAGRLFLILTAIGLVLIVSALDTSVVSVAVPSITAEFQTVADVGWYSSAHRLCTCSFQFMFGKLYQVAPVRTVFLGCVVILMLGSVVCASAPSSAAFVVGRAISGFATAGLLSGCFVLLVYCMPLRRRPLYASIMAAVEAMAEIASPILGGAIIERLGWRWCFWIALPVAGLAFLGLFFFLSGVVKRLPEQSQLTWRQTFSQLDLVGNVLFVPSLTCLFIALSWAGTHYPWNSPIIIGLLCAFTILLGLFAWSQHRRGDSATLPPRILRSRSVRAGFLFSFCCNGSLNVVMYYLPTYFQTVRGFSPSQSGYMLLPAILGCAFAMLLQGAGVAMAGYYVPFMLAGSILMPVFSGLLTTLTLDMEIARVLAYAGLFGFAGGIGFQAPQSAVQTVLPVADASMGLAIVLFGQQFGPALFVSVAHSIFTNRLAENLDGVAPGLNATSIESMGLTNLGNRIAADSLRDVLAGFDKSLTQTWYLAVALTCLSMVGSMSMEWRSVKQKRS